LKRGDIVTVALQGDFGKPRPALVLETDFLAPTRHVILCIGTGTLRDDVEPRRVLVNPSDANGLRVPTQFQVDKLVSAQRAKCGEVVGRLEGEAMEQVDRLLVVLLGLAD
jgi:mRNA interferase MazF